MVIDTSALAAILLNESATVRLVGAIESDPTRLVSAASVIELSLVMLGRFGEAGDNSIDRLLKNFGARIVPVDESQVAVARDAALRFGRGRHSAALNFGDCFSYALAVELGEPLLFVGDDFSKTDVEVVAW